MKLSLTDSLDAEQAIILIGTKGTDYSEYITDKKELDFLKSRIRDGRNEVAINQYHRYVFVCHAVYKDGGNLYEQLRLSGHKIQKMANTRKIKKIGMADLSGQKEWPIALAEGLILGNYQFLRYRNDRKEEANALSSVRFLKGSLKRNEISELLHVCEGVYLARDLVNEPVSTLTAVKLSGEIEKAGRKAGFSVEVFHRKKIESLRMGGLLAVNRGSVDPPTFSILTYEPGKAKNKKPVVLVGKGVTYDTGGLSLKPTHDSMDYMKSDMAGGAAVLGAIYAAAMNELPVRLIGLVPATDNRPDGNAYAPGDVIEMFDGTTVEVLNTDAEGRMILADALSWAKKYDPMLVINLATLTGSAMMALGRYGIAAMGNADPGWFNKLKASGDRVCERIAEFPFWDDYAELLKSDVADIKNIGGRYAGAITAGKFLEHFTDYPFIHLDIAGPSFNKASDAYRGKGGSGVCVRLLYDFLKTQF